MQRLGLLPDVGNATSEGRLELDVLVVYEDFGTGLRATRALDQTALQLTAEADFHVNLWKFEVLREPVLHQQAVNEGVEADIVFVSAHGDQALPEGVKLWVQQWLARKGVEPCALAVSLDADAGDPPTGIEMLQALRTAARLADVDVFLHLGEGQTEWEATAEDIQRRAEMTTTLLDEVLHQVDPQSYRHWGINE